MITELSTPTKGESDDADENDTWWIIIPRFGPAIPKSDQSRKTHIKGKFGVGITMRKGLKNGLKKL